MLNEILDKGLFSFEDKCESWQEAIKKSCETLVAHDYVEEDYADQIIDCINEYGPYIVIMPKVALPHTQLSAKGVKKTGISFMRLNEAVAFDKDDRDLDAQIFFTLASEDSEQHLKNVSSLADMLCNEGMVNELIEAENEEDLRRIAQKYLS